MDWITHPLTGAASIAIVAFTLGIWIDWLLRRLERKDAYGLHRLGGDCGFLSHHLTTHDGTIKYADVISILESLRKTGIKTPIFDRDTSMSIKVYLRHYLEIVGKLLVNGHIEMAKREAQEIIGDIPPNVYPPREPRWPTRLARRMLRRNRPG